MSNSIMRRRRFYSAHFLPNVAETHKCRRMHGHAYIIDLKVTGPLDPVTGFIVDYWDLDSLALDPLIMTVDHYCLNDIPGLENPTAEIIAKWCWGKIEEKLPRGLEITEVKVWETEECCATVSAAK